MSMILKISDPCSLIEKNLIRENIQINNPPNSNKYRLLKIWIKNFDPQGNELRKLRIIPTQVSFFFSLKSRVVNYIKKNKSLS